MIIRTLKLQPLITSDGDYEFVSKWGFTYLPIKKLKRDLHKWKKEQ